MNSSKGFTLIEVLAVISILGIISGIAVPSVVFLIDKSKKDVCDVNVKELERFYEASLDLESVEHSDTLFTQYLQDYGEEICPQNGDISYVDGEVECSLHSEEDGNESGTDDGGNEGVPFL